MTHECHPTSLQPGDTVVMKIGGAGANSPTAVAALAQAIRSSHERGHRCVVVHGGGQQLTDLADRLGVSSPFVAGRRVTDDRLIEAAKMAFAGQVGTDLAAGLWSCGIRAASLSGVDAGCVLVTKRQPVKVELESDGATCSMLVDYGWVGDVKQVDLSIIHALSDRGIVPLIASLGVDAEGHVYNVNADTIACALAYALKAERLVLLTDVHGVYADCHDPATLIPRIKSSDIPRLRAEGIVSGGMLPKLKAVLDALDHGVRRVHMVSWQDQTALEEALCGKVGRGTLFEV